MFDKLKKSLGNANKTYIEVLKFFKWLVVFFAKMAWVACPPLILIEPLWILAVPIIGYWCVFWMHYFFDDWMKEDPELIM